jgi:tRNA/tmRNA/rRNA uracil-C5-methylase (TrmA/RlmC/RlmD family)
MQYLRNQGLILKFIFTMYTSFSATRAFLSRTAIPRKASAGWMHLSVKRRSDKYAELNRSTASSLVEGQEVQLQIDDVTSEGVGVGRINGVVVMVPFCLPGETVLARVFRHRKNYAEGELLSVLTPSADRVQPTCPYFGQCGGCQYQHASIDAQRRIKRGHVLTAFKRIAGIENITVNDVVGTDDVLKYRTKMTPSYGPSTATKGPIVGFQQQSRRQLLSIDRCLLVTDAVHEAYAPLKEQVEQTYRSKRAGSLNIRETSDTRAVIDYSSTIEQKVGPLKFEYSAGSFFQVNKYALPSLVEHVILQASGHGCTQFIDTYCGSGLFATFAASHFETVIGIELVESAIKSAMHNAVLNNITNVKFQSGDATLIFAAVRNSDPSKTVVIIDPPRKGCDDIFINQLVNFSPKKVVYVSCDPATQARDAKKIVSAGYSIIDVTPFDMFPQTRHIENVVTFVKS